MEKSVIIDFDALREKKPRATFIRNGKKYTIPPPTYDMLVHLSEIDVKLEEAMEKKDAVAIMDLSISGVVESVPTLTETVLREDFTLEEIRGIGNLINQGLTQGDSLEDPEALYYREKYGDEYRKNLEGTKEKRKERKSKKS